MFSPAQLSLPTPDTCTCWGPGYDQERWQEWSSSLINLFPLILLARFPALIWIFGLSKHCVYFQRASQRSVGMTCQAPLQCQRLDTLEQPCFPLEGLFKMLMLTFLGQLSDVSVTAVCTTLFLFRFTFHSTKLDFTNPFLGARRKPSKEAPAARAYHCYLLPVSSTLDMGRDLPPMLKFNAAS